MIFRTSIATLATALASSMVLVPPPATALPGVERSAVVKPKPGKYRGTTLDEDGPQQSEFVEFKVSKNGKLVTGFRTRIGMYCYIGPPVYNQIIPTVIKAPTLKIKRGKVDQGWTEIYEADGLPYTITGRVVMRFKRGRVVTGRIAVDFASCGTTTESPAGYIKFRVRRK